MCSRRWSVVDLMDFDYFHCDSHILVLKLSTDNAMIVHRVNLISRLRCNLFSSAPSIFALPHCPVIDIKLIRNLRVNDILSNI